jgi:hypothetical protein
MPCAARSFAKRPSSLAGGPRADSGSGPPEASSYPSLRVERVVALICRSNPFGVVVW